MAGPRLSLALIARNEESMLPGCLDSVRGVVDEMVVVDTGSADRTRELAQAAGARVLSIEWPDDFAAARNVAVMATEGDWILVLDADERLAPGAGAVVRDAIARDDFDCAILRWHDATRRDATPDDILSGRARLCEPGPVPRLFRRPARAPYRGIIHEGIEDYIVEQRWRVRPLPVDILHFGALPEVRQARAKDERNRRLLQRRCAEEPDNPVPYGYLAIAHLRAGLLDEARAVAEAGWERLDWQSTTAYRRSGERLAVARAKLQMDAGDTDGALATLRQIVAYEGERPNYALLDGLARENGALRSDGEARRRQLEDAAAAYQRWRPLHSHILSHCDIGGSPGWIALRLGTVLLQLHRFAEALPELEAACAQQPNDKSARLGRLEARLALGRLDGLGDELAQLADDRPDAWLLAAALSEAQGALAELPEFMAEAARRVGRGWHSRHRALRLAELAAALSAYRGQPVVGSGRLRVLGAIMSGAAAATPTLPWETPDEPFVRALVANLARAEQRPALERLAACALPIVAAAARAQLG